MKKTFSFVGYHVEYSNLFNKNKYMRKSARLQSSIEILDQYTCSNIPLDRFINSYFKARKFMGSKDRHFISELVYNTIRFSAQINWHIQDYGFPLISKYKILVSLLLLEHFSFEELEEINKTPNSHGMEVLSSKEMKFLKEISERTLHYEGQESWIKANLPQWLYERLQLEFGKDCDELCEALLTEASFDIRCNTLKSTPQDIETFLNSNQISFEKSQYCQDAFKLQKRFPVGNFSLFKEGGFEVQDEGSQFIVNSVQAKPGERVLDYCAGAGGKTLGIAAHMENKGTIIACDIDEKRLGRAKKRLKRGGVHIAQLRPLQESRHWQKKNKNKFDKVLLDVPCSGTGTIRRNPDLKWKLNPENLIELVAIQRDILDKGSQFVKPGGHLIYATCSLLREENQNIVLKFLESHNDFKLCKNPIINDSEFVNLYPHTHNTDGFFVVVMRKNG